ncbi:MAG: MFS transporter [Saprospiraceae bacterium]|nr:MFS transporter [Saprospiraceae bacterium]
MSNLSSPAANEKNNPRTINGWAFFDWANSAYALVITVAIFPAYFLSVTGDGNKDTVDYVTVFGIRFINSALFAYSISFAYLIIAAISPLLSGIADYGGRRMRFMRFFTLMGALACMSLMFFQDMNTLWVGIAGFILATVGFAGGIVFYNSYLPVIATEDRYDDVSAKGFSYGFIGSVILLIVNLVVISNYKWFGIEEEKKGVAVLAAFIMVGLWWIGFAQIPFNRLPKDQPTGNRENLMTKGYEEIRKAWRNLRQSPNTLRFLFAFFCYNAGVQAVLFLASTFAENELGFNSQKLIYLVLILQIVAIGGAWTSAKLSGIKGNKFSIVIMLVIWTAVCITGYYVQTGLDFYLLAAAVGLVMGGIQSLSRSTYAKLLPENTPDTTSYFSFYDVMDKVSTVVGTFTFGLVEQITGDMRDSVRALAVFFLISLAVISWVKIKRMS